MTTPLKVDIWSDVQCPWCYIGKRKFEAAVEQYTGEVEVEYHSYLLSPETPVDYPGTTVDYLVERKGFSEADVKKMLEQVTTIARDVGLHYDFDTVKPTNTVKAHELTHFAAAHGAQVEVTERLMKAYFVDGRHVGDIDELVAIAGEAGLDEHAAREALETGRYAPDVEADLAQAAAFGISGVPFFVIDGRYGISGAQGTDVFVSALAEAASTRT